MSPEELDLMFPDAGVQADCERIPSEYERAGSEIRTEDYSDAAPSPPPRWVLAWQLGDDFDKDCQCDPPSYPDFEEPDWPSEVLLQLEEEVGQQLARERARDEDADDLTAVEEYWRDVEASLPPGITVAMLK